MRGHLHARRTLKGLAADLRLFMSCINDVSSKMLRKTINLLRKLLVSLRKQLRKLSITTETFAGTTETILKIIRENNVCRIKTEQSTIKKLNVVLYTSKTTNKTPQKLKMRR